jgi:hypothetical protein
VRTLLVLVAISLPAVAHAEPVLELNGGIAFPVGDDDWTEVAEPSPGLAVGLGSIGANGLGGLLRLDYAKVALDNEGGSFGIGDADISGHRFRVLVDGALRRRVAPKLFAGVRLGAGIDIAHASARVTVLGNTTTSSDTDVGLAFELAGGLWFDVGGAQIGGELVLPIATHSKQGNATDGNYTFDYTSYDLAIMLSVRLGGR